MGWNLIVVFMVIVNAAGGLIVGIVVKYADNVLKGFAVSISVIISSILSVIFFGFEVSFLFVIGSILVLGAAYLYQLPETPVPNRHDVV
jgi:UDP-sugar transporter A1/2/3